MQHTETEQMNVRKTSCKEILSYFKLINGWLNSKLCAKRKSLHSDENAYVFFVKKETLKFVIELREKYKGTKLPNASNFIARSQILMFPF